MTWWRKFSKPHLHIPNGLSLLRGLIGISLPLLILSPDYRLHLLADILFTIGAITDYYDGELARRQNLVSDFGKIADPTMDKILILAPLIAFAHAGFYSIWWIVPIAAREIVITFCRLGWLRNGQAVGAEKIGKIKFGLQVAAVGCGLAHLMVQDFEKLHLFQPFVYFLLILVLGIALLLTLISGYSFLRSNQKLFLDYRFAKFTAALGVGLIPLIPGTWGSLFGIALVWLTHWNALLFGATLIFLFFSGYWSVNRLRLTEDKDPHFVVVDEGVGMMISLAYLPFTWKSALAAFLFFRMLDVVKPFPLRRLERLPGFWGIMMDDVGAGIYAWILVKCLLRFQS